MAFNMRVQLPSFLGGATMRMGDTSEAVKVASQYQRLLEELETALKAMRGGQVPMRNKSMRDKLVPAVARRSDFILNIWNKYPNKEEITDELEKAHWGRERRMMLVTNLFQTFLPEMEAVGNPIIDAVRLPVAITQPSLARAEKWNMLEKLVAEWDDLGAGCFAGKDHWDFIRKQPRVFSQHDDPEFNIVFDVRQNARSNAQAAGQRQIHTLIEEVERRRAAWTKEWMEVSDGFLLDDENFRSPHSVAPVDDSKNRAFQRRSSDFSQVKMSMEDQKRLVWDYNHILDELQRAVSTQLELQGRPVKANEVHNAAQLRSAGAHQLDMVRSQIEARHAALAHFAKRPEEQRRVLQFQENVGSDVGVWSMRRRRKLRDEMFRVQNLCGEAMMDSPGLAHMQRTIQLVTNLCCMESCPAVARGIQQVPTVVFLIVLLVVLALLVVYIVQHGFNLAVHILLGVVCLAIVAVGVLLAVRTFSPEMNQAMQDYGHGGVLGPSGVMGPSHDSERGIYAAPSNQRAGVGGGIMEGMFGGGGTGDYQRDPYNGQQFQHDGYAQRGMQGMDPQYQQMQRDQRDMGSPYPDGHGQQGMFRQDDGYGPQGRPPPQNGYGDNYGSSDQLLPRDGHDMQGRYPSREISQASQGHDRYSPNRGPPFHDQHSGPQQGGYGGYGGPPQGDYGEPQQGGYGGGHGQMHDDYGGRGGPAYDDGGYGGGQGHPQGGYGGGPQHGGYDGGGYGGGPQQGGYDGGGYGGPPGGGAYGTRPPRH